MKVVGVGADTKPDGVLEMHLLGVVWTWDVFIDVQSFVKPESAGDLTTALTNPPKYWPILFILRVWDFAGVEWE